MNQHPTKKYNPFVCPHCNKETGFSTTYWTKFYQTYDEYGEAFSAEGTDHKGGKVYKCDECGKIITKAVKEFAHREHNYSLIARMECL